MSIKSHNSYSTNDFSWGRCFIAQPTFGAESDTKKGVA